MPERLRACISPAGPFVPNLRGSNRTSSRSWHADRRIDESIAAINTISGYQSGRTAAVKIKPPPLDQHQYAIFEFDNLEQMNKQPGEPCAKTGEMKAS